MYEFGRFRLDPANHLLVSEGTPISLTPKAFEVLLVLVQNGGKLTTKEELMRKVWPDSFVEEANLTVNVSALRKLLGETTDHHLYIETVPKKGYRFVAPITETKEEWQSQVSPSGGVTQESVSVPVLQVETSSHIQGLPQTFSTERYWPHFAIPLLVLVVAAGVVYMAYSGHAIRRHYSRQPHSLAVLPFQNLRTDTESEFLGFSLADAVISKLGYVSELTVRPSYSIQKYKAQAIDIRRVASERNVDTLLTGTFLREGGDLRITCQLIGTDTQIILWKGVFDLKYEKLLTVQDRVAGQIIKGLELTLSPSESARLRRDEAVSPVAYDYYLRGIDLYSTGEFPMAIKMLEKASLGPLPLKIRRTRSVSI